MKITNPFNDSKSDDTRAVSPVIGVILMVAITVILAAIIGSFVLDLGDSLESAPQASINFDYDRSSDEITIEHRGGEDLDPSNVELRINGTEVSGDGNELGGGSNNAFADVADDPFSAGSSVSLTNTSNGFKKGTQIDIVFVGGERSDVLASFEVPRDSSSVS